MSNIKFTEGNIMLKIKNISVGYRQKKVIQDLSLNFSAGEFCALLGPNGAGKSTLLKALIKFMEIESGEILLNNNNLQNLSHKETAKIVSMIPQDFQLQFDYKVKDLVIMGRFPHLGYWQNYSKKDEEITENILKQLDLIKYKDTNFSQLSGGEKQRVSIARSLAQETDVILMDEAFVNLDVNHQLEIMQILSGINKTQNKTIILVSHNINLASDYCNRVIMMKEGRIIADGKPEAIINEDNIKELFDAELKMIINPGSGKPNLIYPGKR
jgi:iron complex transport system ATP-binding protein